jgi:hypothetical protein
MSRDNLAVAAVKSTPYVARLSLGLAWTYLTLGHRVRRMRRAFEKQLTAQGMSKADAQRLSASFEVLKNEITATVKQSLTLRSR